MRLGSNFFSSGGIGYHFRAAKYSENLWDAYRANLNLWLSDWPQKNPSLLLVGPSAGYSLDEKFLRRYKKIYVSEPDPMARILLRRRFSNLSMETIGGDFIFSNRPFLDGDILFCNMLGQLRLKQESITKLLEKLNAKNFASYHDLFSFNGNFHWRSEKISVGGEINEDHLFSLFIQSQSQELTIEDHGLLNVFPSQSRLVLHWEIVPNRHHLIECVSSNSLTSFNPS